MRLQVLMLYQDDPKKCTAAKMIRFGLAQSVKKIGNKGMVLDPFSERFLLPRDKNSISSIVGVDCSWNLAEQAFSKRFDCSYRYDGNYGQRRIVLAFCRPVIF